MKKQSSLKPAFFLFVVFIFSGIAAQSQQTCAVFKSEISDVKDFEMTVNRLTDSLRTYAETAAYAARFTEGRTNARKVETLAGEALEAANQAVSYAAEAQYHAEVCGLEAVVTHAINAEAHSIDARDFAEAAYTNAKKASVAGKLGDIHFLMRRSLQAAIDARKASEKATYAAFDAFASCTHDDGTAVGQN